MSRLKVDRFIKKSMNLSNCWQICRVICLYKWYSFNIPLKICFIFNTKKYLKNLFFKKDGCSKNVCNFIHCQKLSTKAWRTARFKITRKILLVIFAVVTQQCFKILLTANVTLGIYMQIYRRKLWTKVHLAALYSKTHVPTCARKFLFRKFVISIV